MAAEAYSLANEIKRLNSELIALKGSFYPHFSIA